MPAAIADVSADGTPIVMYAWHEAGHAVYAIVKELGLSRVWIDQAHAPSGAPPHGCEIPNPDSEEIFAGYYMGGAAGEILLGLCDRYDLVAHALKDYEPVMKMAAAKRLSKANEIAWIRAREVDAEQVLAANRPAFDAVVNRLLIKRILTGKEVLDLVTGATTP